MKMQFFGIAAKTPEKQSHGVAVEPLISRKCPETGATVNLWVVTCDKAIRSIRHLSPPPSEKIFKFIGPCAKTVLYRTKPW